MEKNIAPRYKCPHCGRQMKNFWLEYYEGIEDGELWAICNWDDCPKRTANGGAFVSPAYLLDEIEGE